MKKEPKEYQDERLFKPEAPMKPLLKQGATSQDFRVHADALERYEERMIKYKEECERVRIHNNKIEETFKSDALHDVGLGNHPKKDMIWDYVWNRCKGEGYNVVYLELEELSVLFV
jgi:hypothetical protein